MYRTLAGVLAVLTGCTPTPIITRVRDPWQVAVVTVTDRGDVPHVLAEQGGGCEWRDATGLPHFCHFGDFLVTDDGALVTPEAQREGATVRLVAHLFHYGWCRRSMRRCFRRIATIAFVTPAANVASMKR